MYTPRALNPPQHSPGTCPPGRAAGGSRAGDRRHAPRPPLTTDRMRARLLEQELAAAEQEREELRSRLDAAQGLVDAADTARTELELTLRRERRAADTAGE